MKSSTVRYLFCFLALLPVITFSQETKSKLNNPVVTIYDGCVERFMGYYYAMGTGTVGKIYKSKNLITWTGPALAAETNEATWLNDSKWTQAYVYKRVGAGDILYRNGVFHIYFNGIGHSYSDKPLGMYKEQCITEPFDDYGIDAQVFQDEDGELYYLKKVNPGDPNPITGTAYGKGGAKTWAFRMDSPFIRKGISGSEQMTHQVGHPTNVDWENFEGPELFKYRDNYYHMFSPNRMSARTGMYFIGAAQSDGPMNFDNSKKYPHPVLMRNMENHHFIYKQLLHTAEHGPWDAKYKTETPSGEWTSPDYDDSDWNIGDGGFGLQTMDIARVRSNRTIWNTDQIYVRRKFTLPEVPAGIALKYRVEANVDFYINGNKLTITGSSTGYSLINVNPEWFIKGENIIAVEAKNTCSGSDCFKFVDFGLFDTKGQDAEKIVIGQSQANYVVGPNGFERWMMYKAFFNGLSSQGIDRMHFYDKELVVESTSTLNSPGYHPLPAQPTFISYFDHPIYYPYEYLNNSEWTISAGVLKPKNDAISGLLLKAEPMTNYRYEIPFRIMSGNGDYMAAYAYYHDTDNWLKIRINRDHSIWEYEIREKGIITKQSYNLPDKFRFLENHPFVSHYEEPWHTLTIYKNGGNFNVELDYFKLTLNQPIQTKFTGNGRLGLEASSPNVTFDAIQYTNGFDEWDAHITGWETTGGKWITDNNGLQQGLVTGKAEAFKGDQLTEYEFSVFMKNDRIPASGKAGFYPLYVDNDNYVQAGIDYRKGKFEVIKKENGNTETQYFELSNRIYRQYTYDTYPTTSYRYDFRCETEASGVDLLWFEGNYPYLNQTFDLPTQVRIYALQDGTWVQLFHQLEGELKFAYFNHFTFDKVRTKAIKIEVAPQTGKACRVFSAYFREELASAYYLRARRENDCLYLFVNDSLKVALDGNWDQSNTGLFTESVTASFNGILHYQGGKVAVTKITVPELQCAINESIHLTAGITPSNATNKHLVWESSNPVIASIDENGCLTRHSEGNITITAWSADGGLVKGSAVLSSPTGIKEQELPALYYYPNPVKDKLYIESEEPIEKIGLYSVLGNEIIVQKAGAISSELDMGRLSPGVYVLYLQTANRKMSNKIIKN